MSFGFGNAQPRWSSQVTQFLTIYFSCGISIHLVGYALRDEPRDWSRTSRMYDRLFRGFDFRRNVVRKIGRHRGEMVFDEAISPHFHA